MPLIHLSRLSKRNSISPGIGNAVVFTTVSYTVTARHRVVSLSFETIQALAAMGIRVAVSFAKAQRKWTVVSLVKEIGGRWADSTIVFLVNTLS